MLHGDSLGAAADTGKVEEPIVVGYDVGEVAEQSQDTSHSTLSIPTLRFTASARYIVTCQLDSSPQPLNHVPAHLGSTTCSSPEIQLYYPSQYGLSRPQREGIVKL